MTQRTQDNDESKSPQEIEAELDETRKSIGEDLRAIGEKLSPEHLKAQAREALVEAKDAASDKLHQMTDSAKERLIEAKDAAVTSISETADEAWQRARKATDASAQFVRSNAVPLAMIGVGVAWLVQSNRNGRHHGWRPPSRRDDVGNGTRGRVSDAASRVGHRAEELGGHATRALGEAEQRARDVASSELQRVRRASTEFARDNPLVLGVAAVAAGVGVGMLIPATNRENELLGGQRDRLFADAKSTVEGFERAAKDAAHDVGEKLSELAGQ